MGNLHERVVVLCKNLPLYRKRSTSCRGGFWMTSSSSQSIGFVCVCGCYDGHAPKQKAYSTKTNKPSTLLLLLLALHYPTPSLLHTTYILAIKLWRLCFWEGSMQATCARGPIIRNYIRYLTWWPICKHMSSYFSSRSARLKEKVMWPSTDK